MRGTTSLLCFCLLAINILQIDGLFGWGEGSRVEVIHPDHGEPTRVHTNNGQDEVDMGLKDGIGHNHKDGFGDLVDIPTAEEATSTKRPSTTTIRTIRTTQRPDVRSRTTTTASSWDLDRNRNDAGKFPFEEERPESGSTSFSGSCPQRVDAFASSPYEDYIFDDKTVYIVKNNRIVQKSDIRDMFPNGPSSVNAAVYNDDKEWILLIKDKSVYAFKHDDRGYRLDSSFPKEMPSNIPFTPYSGVRWHDTRQMLLSNGGQFAMYDAYWNKSLISGRTMLYFVGLPDKTKGIGQWSNGKADIFTPTKVYKYDKDAKKVLDDGIPLDRFLSC